jgi:hypothetical protein
LIYGNLPTKNPITDSIAKWYLNLPTTAQAALDGIMGDIQETVSVCQNAITSIKPIGEGLWAAAEYLYEEGLLWGLYQGIFDGMDWMDWAFIVVGMLKTILQEADVIGSKVVLIIDAIVLATTIGIDLNTMLSDCYPSKVTSTTLKGLQALNRAVGHASQAVWSSQLSRRSQFKVLQALREPHLSRMVHRGDVGVPTGHRHKSLVDKRTGLLTGDDAEADKSICMALKLEPDARKLYDELAPRIEKRLLDH